MSAVVTAPQDQTKERFVARRAPQDLDRHRQPSTGPIPRPVRRRLPQRGADVVVTARDYGNALELLAQRTSSFAVVGGEFGRSKTAKVAGALRRAEACIPVAGPDRPDALLCASRSSALAARRMGMPSFVIGDYEYSNSSIYRLTRSTILYPDVIDPAPLLASGVRPRTTRRVSRDQGGHLARADRDRGHSLHRFPEIQDDALVRVLFRPPAEKSHYYNPDSRRLALRTLEHLAEQPDVSSSSLRAMRGRRTSFCE